MGGSLRRSKVSSTTQLLRSPQLGLRGWECHPDGSPATSPWPQGWSPGCGGRAVRVPARELAQRTVDRPPEGQGRGGRCPDPRGGRSVPLPCAGGSVHAAASSQAPQPPVSVHPASWGSEFLVSALANCPKTPKLLLACLPWESLPSSGVHPPLPRDQRRASTRQRGQSRAAPEPHAQGSSRPSSWPPSWGPSPRTAPEGS